MKGPKLLLADDDAEYRSWVRLVLRRIPGVGFLEAADGGELLSQLEREPEIDLAIVDVRMPVMDGLVACRRARERGCQIPFLVVTAYPGAEVEDAVRSLGRAALLAKPLDGDDLLQAIHRLRADSASAARPPEEDSS